MSHFGAQCCIVVLPLQIESWCYDSRTNIYYIPTKHYARTFSKQRDRLIF